MISQRSRGLRNILLLIQGVLLILAFGICAAVTFTFFTSTAPFMIGRFPIYGAVLIAGLVVEAMNRSGAEAQANLFERDFLGQHRLTLRQSIYTAGALLIYLTAMKEGSFISRTFLAMYLPSLYLTLLCSNYFLPRTVARRVFAGLREERVLLVGSTHKAEGLKEWLKSKEIFGLRAVGILSEEDAGDGRGLAGLPKLGQPSDAAKIIEQYGVTKVILLELPKCASLHNSLVNTVERAGIRLLILNNLAEQLNHSVVHIQDEGHSFITLRAEPLENPLNRLLKRALDIVVALPVVLFVIPAAALVVWIAQCFQSRGPLFYRQRRAGLQNREFEILKFRTMHLNGHAARQATKSDSRIYPLGRWLRKLSIDELPQFINVLKGDMSVSGPRPHLTDHNEQFAKEMSNYQIRTVVKPGITGLAQVRGFRGEARTATDISRRIESDIVYLENWRFALDLAIIARTIWQMVCPPKTAY